MTLGSMLGVGAWKQRLPRDADLLPGRDQPLPLRVGRMSATRLSPTTDLAAS